MMRKVFSIALMATLALAFGLVQKASAGVTVDVVFQDATVPTGITILPGDVGPGCTFTGWNGTVYPTGRCMDVILTTTYAFTGFATSVGYDSDNGLDVAAMYEWRGLPVSWNKLGVPVTYCTPPQALTDTGSRIQSFDCIIPPPVNPPSVAAGTYRVGTIIWDTSGTTVGTETIAAVINDLFDGMAAVINGVTITLRSSDITVGSHILTIVPEPGTASLLGLGLIGLILAGRRSRS